jgi:hypothetical protein
LGYQDAAVRGMTNPLYYCLRRGQAAAAAGGAQFPTITTTKNGTFKISIRGTNGVDVHLDMGDGTIETMSLLGLGSWVNLDHAYTGGVHRIKILDSWSDISRLSCEITPEVISFNLSLLPALTQLYIANNPGLVDISSISETSVGDLAYLINNAITDISPITQSAATSIYLTSNPVVYTGYTWATKTSGVYRFASTVTTAAEVDLWLSDLNTALWSNCTIYLDGTNPAPTAGAADDIAALVVRGCTVYTS